MACPEAQTQQSKQAAPELQGASKQVAPEIRCTWKDSHSHSSAQPSNAAKGASCHEEPSWDALSALEEDRKNQLRWQNAEVLQGGKGNYGLGWTGAAELCLCSILQLRGFLKPQSYGVPRSPRATTWQAASEPHNSEVICGSTRQSAEQPIEQKLGDDRLVGGVRSSSLFY